MNATSPLVVGLGELLWDDLPTGRFPGGAPANFAAHASRLGGRGAVVSAVGDDPAGADLIAWLRHNGLDPAHVQRHPLPTGRVSVALDRDGLPNYHIHAGVAWDAIAWDASLAALARRADAVCVGSLAQRSPVSRRTIGRFLAATRPGCLRVFDLNLRDPHRDADVLRQTLPMTTLFKLNDGEWPFVAEHLALASDPVRGLGQLLDRLPDLRYAALTRGAAGSVVVAAGVAANGVVVDDLPGEATDVVDTVGAGDAFTAALAVGLLGGASIESAHRAAADVARYVCGRAGATPALPPWLAEAVAPVQYRSLYG